MSAERINGIKLNLETMTDQELGNLLDTRVQAMLAAEKDVTRVLDVMEQRGIVPEPEEVAHQDRLFE